MACIFAREFIVNSSLFLCHLTSEEKLMIMKSIICPLCECDNIHVHSSDFITFVPCFMSSLGFFWKGGGLEGGGVSKFLLKVTVILKDKCVTI